MDDPENEVADGLSDPLLVHCTAGDKFTLPFPDKLASTRIYDHQWTILPSKVANIPCASIEPDALLDTLNTIFDTHFNFSPGVEACLEEFIDDGCDLGEVYGYLRPWWPRDGSVERFDTIPEEMQARREKDYNLRSKAVTGNRIRNSSVPPRRVWDLYANRVLPYYVLKPGEDWKGREALPKNLWTVSHTWRPLSERQSVLTTINGKMWRVPIPRGTTLNAIRDELLILGAEYIFLDVLCLRQKDEHLPELESVRKREWRLDIPTIGFVYNENLIRPVVVCFNGLGLPFRNERVDPNDQFHWFNRVWTLQETPFVLIFGGLEHKFQQVMLYSSLIHGGIRWPPGIREEFRNRILSFPKSYTMNNTMMDALDRIGGRSYSNPVDQVACLAYLVGCPTLPIYDADMDVEVAWSLLVECLAEKDRARLLFCDFKSPETRSGSWRPTWKQVQMYIRSAGHADVMDDQSFWEYLMHLEGSSPTLGYRYGIDVYYHEIDIVRGCRIDATHTPGTSAALRIKIPLGQGKRYISLPITAVLEPSVILDKEYILVKTEDFGLSKWIVAEFKG